MLSAPMHAALRATSLWHGARSRSKFPSTRIVGRITRANAVVEDRMRSSRFSSSANSARRNASQNQRVDEPSPH